MSDANTTRPIALEVGCLFLAPSVVPLDRDVGIAPTADYGLATRLTRC